VHYYDRAWSLRLVAGYPKDVVKFGYLCSTRGIFVVSGNLLFAFDFSSAVACQALSPNRPDTSGKDAKTSRRND
jgi:hypothetical protein